MHILGRLSLFQKYMIQVLGLHVMEHINTKTDSIPLVFLVQILLSSVSGSLMMFI